MVHLIAAALGEDESPAQDAGRGTVIVDQEINAAEEGEQLVRTCVKRKAPKETACYLCKEPWTWQSAHRICCIPCGHVHGRSCLENRLRSEAKCPQCKKSFEPNDIINLYVTEHLWNGCGHEKFIARAQRLLEENSGRLLRMECRQGRINELLAKFTECGSAVDSYVDGIKNIFLTEDTVATTVEKLGRLQRRIASRPTRMPSKDAGHGLAVAKREETSADAERGSNLATCGICMDGWTSYGGHRICCIPCGHVYGRSCLEKWLRYCGDSTTKCPLCRKSFQHENIIPLSPRYYKCHHKERSEMVHRLKEFVKRFRHVKSLAALNDERRAHIAEYVSKTTSLWDQMKEILNSNADRSKEDMLNVVMELLRRWPKMHATV